MLRKLINWLESANRVLILFHESPDGDAVSSSLALKRVLEQKGKMVDCACHDVVPDIFMFLPGTEDIKQDFILGDYDLVCTLDCGDSRRTGFPERVKFFSENKSRVINIDHHTKNDLHKIANINYIDEGAAATTELVYRIVSAMGVKIDKHIATLLLTGLYTDTGGFQHSNTSPRVYGLASKLLARGGQLGRITHNIGLNKPLTSLKLWGLAMSRVQKNDYGIVVSYITRSDFSELRATQEDLAGVVNIINSIPEARIAILFAEQPGDKIRASIRTEHNDIDVSMLARMFGGGGHKKASGFTLDGRILESDGSWAIDLV